MFQNLFKPKSKDVLAHIIKRYYEKGYQITISRCIKVLFICYGYCLAKYNFKLTKEDPVVYTKGPMFPEAWIAYSDAKLNYDKQLKLNSQILDTIDDVIDQYGPMDFDELTESLRAPGTPWNVSSNNGDLLYRKISDTLIKTYYKKQLESKLN